MTPFWLEQLGRLTAFAGRIVCEIPYCLLHPLPSLVQWARLIWGTFWLAAIIGVAMGLVAWMHVGSILNRFDSQTLLPTLLAVTVVLEVGPVTVGLVAASRIASGMASELAAMKVAEQLDALSCLGVDPLRRLVVPRVLACVLLLPPLTLFVDFTALLGGFAAESAGGQLTWTLYRDYALDHLHVYESTLATMKTAVFGLLVGVLSCWLGLQAGHGTEAVGRAATRAVVWSTLAVLLSNILLVRLIHLLV